MQTPYALESLVDEGIIERVLRPLMSGKEAQVFLVEVQGELRVAKVYKDSQQRSFKNRAVYTEGRKTRNSRDQRAVDKRTKHGRSQDEDAWKFTEVDMIHRLHAGGVRVPIPHAFIDGVLVMECVVDPEGNPAPRLGDVAFDAEGARVIYDKVIREVVRMLAVGVVHGDLSDFNVLVSGDTPVIIDFPQSVDTAKNTNARRLLIRDVDNLHRFLSRYVPTAPRRPYAEEMWELHEHNALTAETPLTGKYRATERATSDDSVFELIQDAERDERKRRDALGLRGGPRPAPAPSTQPSKQSGGSPPPRDAQRRHPPEQPRQARGNVPQPPQQSRSPQRPQPQQQQQSRSPQRPQPQAPPQPPQPPQQSRSPQRPQPQPPQQRPQQQSQAPRPPPSAPGRSGAPQPPRSDPGGRRRVARSGQTRPRGTT